MTSPHDFTEELLVITEKTARSELLAELITKAMKTNELQVALWLADNGKSLMEEL